MKQDMSDCEPYLLSNTTMETSCSVQNTVENSEEKSNTSENSTQVHTTTDITNMKSEDMKLKNDVMEPTT